MRGLESRIIALAILLWADLFSHYILSFIHTNGAYLFVCANFNLLSLMFALKNKPTKLMKDISLLIFTQMIIQISAWVCAFFIYPYFYHDAIRFIVIITYLRLFLIRKNDGSLWRYPRWLLFSTDYNLVNLARSGVHR